MTPKDSRDAANLDKPLASALKQAKTKRIFFGVVAKSSQDGKLFASKVKVKPSALAAAKKELGGGKIVRGDLFVEDGKHVFEMAKKPAPFLAKLVKKLAKTQAQMAIKPICRQAAGADESQEHESDEPSPQSSDGHQPDIAAMREAFKKRATAIKAGLADLKATKSPLFGDLNKKFANAVLLAGGGRMPQALVELEAIEAALHHATGDSELSPTDSELSPTDSELSPTESGSSPGKKAPVGKVAYTKSRLAWDQARKSAHANIESLRQTILAESADDPDRAQIVKACDKFDALLAQFDDRLMDALDAALNADTPAKEQTARAAALAEVKRYAGMVGSHKLLAGIDSNPFRPMKVRSTLVATIKSLMGHLAG